MTGLAVQEIDHVWQQMDDRPERLNCALGAAGDIQDEGLPACAAEAAAEDGELSVLESFGAHDFGDTFDELVAYRAGYFGRDITRGNSRAACRDNKIGAGTGVEKRVSDLGGVIGNDGGTKNVEIVVGKKVGNGGTGEIFAVAVEGRIRDGDDDGGH